MYLSDFVFFTLTLSILVALSVISAWDRIGQYTDWQASEHMTIKKKLEKFVTVVEIDKTKLQSVSLPTVPVKCTCGEWGRWNNNFIDTPPCCRNQTVTAFKSLVKHLDKYHIKYTLSGGTLLGAVRCGEFIQYDYDADILIFTTERLLKVTLDKWHKSDVDGIFKKMSLTMTTNVNGMETHELKGSPNGAVHFDIGAYEEMDTVPCLFEGMVMQCRSDFKSTLKKTYGSDWMIPHRWKEWPKKLMKDIDNKQLNRCINQRKEMQAFCKVYDNFAIGDKGCKSKKKSLDDKQEYDCSSIIPNGLSAMTKTSPPFKMFLHPVEQDIHVSGMIKRSGVWEHDQINLFTRYLKEYPSALFVDVGLNIGMYGLVAAANGHKVIAFEPLLLNLDRVCSTINWNKWNNLITIYPYAITNTATKVSFSTPRENAGGTSVRDNKSLDGVENVDFANAYTFDSFNISYDGPILMKIDIEGHECQMFEKINKFFANNDVRLIMIEWGQLVNKCGDKIADTLLMQGLMPYDAAGKEKYALKLKPWSRGVWDMIWKKPFTNKGKTYEYKAQAGQDRYVEQFLKHENGVYVEFGARDGIEHSNTYYFEKTYNWTGILVEPDDRELKKITINRPNAHIYTGVAVCPVGTKEVTFAISSNRGWSGIQNSYDDNRWVNTVINQKKIPCVDLNEICPEHVDYMTVDTEGSEVEILRTFDFTSHDVTIIQVERNMKTQVQRNEEKQLTQFMSNKGYEKIKQIDIGNWAVDCIYKKII